LCDSAGCGEQRYCTSKEYRKKFQINGPAG
jgi:hypothetical protein